MKKHVTLLISGMLFLSIVPNVVAAQSTGFNCGTDQARKQLIQQHPEIVALERGVEEYTQRYMADYLQKQASRSTIDAGQKIIIPLVFHIIEQGGEENIPDAQVIDEVRILNRDYNRQNGDTADVIPSFKAIIASMGIEFRLAGLDPNGQCTNGIDRIYSVQTYQGDDYSKLNGWPREKYINIWLVSDITVLGGSAAGYAYFPADVASIYNIPNMDGVIILYPYIGSIDAGSDLTSRALTHEIGHCFNLEHTWGLGQCGQACGDDGVNDTPITKGFCGSCPETAAAAEICNPPIIENYQNYMEYSYCSVMFTNGQKARALAALDTTIAQRNNLWTPANLIATGTADTPAAPCAPVADFYASSRYVCEGSNVTFYNNSTNGTVDSYSWSIPGGTPSSSTNSSVTVQFDGAGWQPVSLTVSNSLGNTTKTDNQLVYAGYSTALSQAPFYEGFENPNVFTDAGTGWAAVNYDENATFFSQSSVAHTGNGCAKLNNYFATANRDIDEIISPPIDLTTLTEQQMNLSFYYSWASDNVNFNSNDDSIVVYASNDCGVTWLHLWDENGSAVIGYWQGEWVPGNQSGEWKKVSIPLSTGNLFSELHKNNVRFKVRVYSSVGGNDFYIDDFNVGNAATGINEVSSMGEVTLFPNPTTGQVTLNMQLTQASKVSIRIMDITGNVVTDAYEGKMEDGDNHLPLNEAGQLAKGIYVVYMQASGSLLQKKLVIQ